VCVRVATHYNTETGVFEQHLTQSHVTHVRKGHMTHVAYESCCSTKSCYPCCVRCYPFHVTHVHKGHMTHVASPLAHWRKGHVLLICVRGIHTHASVTDYSCTGALMCVSCHELEQQYICIYLCIYIHIYVTSCYELHESEALMHSCPLNCGFSRMSEGVMLLCVIHIVTRILMHPHAPLTHTHRMTCVHIYM